MARWTSFVADPDADPPRTLHEDGNPDHRLRVEHDERTLLIHLSGEDGAGWTVMAGDRATRPVPLPHGPPRRDAGPRPRPRARGGGGRGAGAAGRGGVRARGRWGGHRG